MQMALINEVLQAKEQQKNAGNALKDAMLKFSSIIDGRGDEEFGMEFTESDDTINGED